MDDTVHRAETAVNRRHLGLPKHVGACAPALDGREAMVGETAFDAAGQAAPAVGLEAGHVVVGGVAGRLGHRFETDEDVGPEAVGSTGLRRGVGVEADEHGLGSRERLSASGDLNGLEVADALGRVALPGLLWGEQVNDGALTRETEGSRRVRRIPGNP